MDVNAIADETLSVIKNLFDVNSVSVVLYDFQANSVIFTKNLDMSFKNGDLKEFVKRIIRIDQSELFVKYEVFNRKVVTQRVNRIKKFMEMYNVELIAPLKENLQISGLMFIGEKVSKLPFTEEDINLFKTIVVNVSVAFGRSVLYGRVQNFNNLLQDKVKEQTKELSAKVVALQDAREKERDMIDIMGHELRTPATIVSLNIDMLNAYWKNLKTKPKDPETLAQFTTYVERMSDGVQREIKLINSLLASAKLDGKRLVLNKEPFDMIQGIEIGIMSQQKAADKKGLHLKFNKPANADDYPLVFADRVRIQEIIDNLINNAVKYTERGSVTVDIEHDREFVKVSVSDTGYGIPEDALKSLGRKFYRVGQYINDHHHKGEPNLVRPGGTGLGLYVTFGLVKAHGGTITVKSTIGKGSVFKFTIPRMKATDKKIMKLSENDVFVKMGLSAN
jgi:signal transduction histidine kinase